MALGTLEEHYKDLWGAWKFIGNKSEEKLAKGHQCSMQSILHGRRFSKYLQRLPKFFLANAFQRIYFKVYLIGAITNESYKKYSNF